MMIRSLVRLRLELIRALKWLLIVLMAVMTLDILWGVASRFLLGDQSSWTEELARVLLIWVVLIGASLAFAEKAHLGLDYLVGKLDPQAKRMARILSHLAILAFAVIVFIIGGSQLVQKTLAMGQQMMAVPIAKGWVYLALPISGVFIVLFAAEDLLELIATDKETNEESKEAGDV